MLLHEHQSFAAGPPSCRFQKSVVLTEVVCCQRICSSHRHGPHKKIKISLLLITAAEPRCAADSTTVVKPRFLHSTTKLQLSFSLPTHTTTIQYNSRSTTTHSHRSTAIPRMRISIPSPSIIIHHRLHASPRHHI